MSSTKLIKLIDEKKNPSVVGLDPMLDYVPQDIIDKAIKVYGKTFKAAGEALFEYNKAIIDSVADIVPCVKPQSAFYELYGTEGEIALKKTIEYARNAGLYVLLDVKRGDIGSTAAAYSSAYLGSTSLFGENACACECDSVTVNPYLGSDGVLPFVKDCEANVRMIFTLVKTSNPSSGELQDMLITNSDGETIPVYMHMASLVKKWGESTVSACGYSNVGAVVGVARILDIK